MILTMKLVLFLLAVTLIGITSAEREYVKVNQFNVSFDLNQTHDVIVDQGDGINGSAKIRTFDGSFTIYPAKYQKAIPINYTWTIEDWAELSSLNILGEIAEIDGHKGIIYINSVNMKPQYAAFYHPDIQEEHPSETNFAVSITSDLSFYATSDLIRSIHVLI